MLINGKEKVAEISALSSGNVSKYEFLTGKYEFLKSCYNEKFWLFSVRQRIKSTNWPCKEAVSKIRRYLWVWQNNIKRNINIFQIIIDQI